MSDGGQSNGGPSDHHPSQVALDIEPPVTDAISLCSQSPYPGDDDLEAMEADIMVRWKLDQPPDVQPAAAAAPYPSRGGGGAPDRSSSQRHLDQARQALAAGQQCDALAYLDLALEADFLNAALWLQRATVLIALGDLREAFRSCAALPPASRTADLWKMGGSILDKLGLPVSAESWFRFATKMAEERETSAAVMFQKVRAKRLYGPLTEGTPVEVIFTTNGRALRATRPVKKGEVLFDNTPIIITQTLPSLTFPCCANCARSLILPEDVFNPQELDKASVSKAVGKYWPLRDRLPCACGYELYCSSQCQAEAWASYHSLLCPKSNPSPSLQKLYDLCDTFKKLDLTESIGCPVLTGWWAASFSPIMLARLWAQIVCSAVRMAHEEGRGDQPSPKDWALARAPYRRFIAYGFGVKANDFHKMHQLMSDIFGDLGNGLSYDITKEEFSGRYLQLACNVQSFSDADNPMGNLIRGVSKDPQFVILLDYLRQKEHEGDFAGLFPVHACMNHSCANNVVVMDGKTAQGRPGCLVKATRDIAAGEEIFNQYIDTKQSRRERRTQLYRSYNFWCMCTRCQFEGDGPDTCTECQKKSKDGQQFPKCSRCQQAWYCSSECQKKSWKRGHKKICILKSF